MHVPRDGREVRTLTTAYLSPGRSWAKGLLVIWHPHLPGHLLFFCAKSGRHRSLHTSLLDTVALFHLPVLGRAPLHLAATCAAGEGAPEPCLQQRVASTDGRPPGAATLQTER